MIKLEKVHYRDKTRRNLYYTILDDKVYFQNHDDNKCYVVDKVKYKILDKSCATHNFTPFKFDGRYFALGGQDNWKVDKKWRGIDYKIFKRIWEDHFQRDYRRGEDFYSEIKYKFDTTPVWKHNHGLYLFESDNGIGWKLHQREPVLTVKHEGFISALEWKSTEFDGRPSIAFYKDKYYIYTRANVSKDMRKVQYTTTKDFKEFETFRQIKTFSEDNEYLINTFVYNNKIFGFIPTYKTKKVI